MSKVEAEEYTRDSYYAGRDFYHGTSQEAASRIVSEGARLTSDVVNSFGDGFYLAFDRDAAIDYANHSRNHHTDLIDAPDVCFRLKT